MKRKKFKIYAWNNEAQDVKLVDVDIYDKLMMGLENSRVISICDWMKMEGIKTRRSFSIYIEGLDFCVQVVE